MGASSVQVRLRNAQHRDLLAAKRMIAEALTLILFLTIFATVVAAVSFIAPATCYAQPWKIDLDASLMLTQTSYTDNWAGGEAGSFAWAFNSNFLGQKQLNPKMLNKNTLRLAFGQTHNQDKETKRWARPTKSTDLVDFESALNLTLGGFVDPFVSGRVETQFLDNADPQNERFLNPADFTEALGITKDLIKQEKCTWSTRLGAGFRQHLNREALTPVTEKRETETSNDGGIEFVSDFRSLSAQEHLELTSKLIVFEAIYFSKANSLRGFPYASYWKAPDIRWDNTLTASITKYMMVSLYTQFLYDKEIDLGGRFKQTLSLGLTYKLK